MSTPQHGSQHNFYSWTLSIVAIVNRNVLSVSCMVCVMLSVGEPVRGGPFPILHVTWDQERIPITASQVRKMPVIDQHHLRVKTITCQDWLGTRTRELGDKTLRLGRAGA